MGCDLSEDRERLVIIDFGVIQDGLKGERIVEEEIYLGLLWLNEHRFPKWTKGVCRSF